MEWHDFVNLFIERPSYICCFIVKSQVISLTCITSAIARPYLYLSPF